MNPLGFRKTHRFPFFVRFLDFRRLSILTAAVFGEHKNGKMPERLKNKSAGLQSKCFKYHQIPRPSKLHGVSVFGPGNVLSPPQTTGLVGPFKAPGTHPVPSHSAVPGSRSLGPSLRASASAERFFFLLRKGLFWECLLDVLDCFGDVFFGCFCGSFEVVFVWLRCF